MDLGVAAISSVPVAAEVGAKPGRRRRNVARRRALARQSTAVGLIGGLSKGGASWKRTRTPMSSVTKLEPYAVLTSLREPFAFPSGFAHRDASQEKLRLRSFGAGWLGSR